MQTLKVIKDSFENATGDNTGIQLSAVQSARYEHTRTHSTGHHNMLTRPFTDPQSVLLIFDQSASDESHSYL